MSGGLRIDLLRVSGFGHFRDYELELNPGLNLLYGPNEAGKSTLLAFIRAMLFGFEKRGRSEQRYEPESGTFGGELCLRTAQGPLVVRRTLDARGKAVLTLSTPEGEAQPASRLEVALAHVTRELFYEVFAFSLEELSSFERLVKEDGVSRALFAAGLQGARRLPELERLLKKRAEERFKPNGRNPALNQVLKELEDVRASLRTLEDRPARYFEERERLASLERQREEKARLGQHLSSELARLSRLEAALDDLEALGRLRAERAVLPDLSAFPAGGEARLDELLHRLKEAHAQQAKGQQQLHTLEAELARLTIAPALRERQEVLRSALAAFTERAESRRTLPGRRAALEERRRQARQALDGLGLAVDAQGLLALELGAVARGALETLADRLAQAQTDAREAQGALGRARVALERLEASGARLEAERARLPLERAEQLQRAQAALGRLRLLCVEREQVVARRQEQQQRLESSRQRAESAPGPEPSAWPVVAGAVGALVLALLLGAYSGAVAGGLALVGALLLVGLLGWAWRRSMATHRQAVEAFELRQRAHVQELERTRSAVDELAGKLGRLQRDVVAAASEAGVPPEASTSVLSAREVALSEALRQAQRWEQLGRELEAQAAERDAAARDVQAASEATRRAEAQGQALRQELASLLRARGLPEDLPAPRALALWREAAELRQRLADLGADEESLAADEAACARVEARLHAEARAAGLGEESLETLSSRVSSALEELKAREVEARTLRARRDELLAEGAGRERLRHEEERALSALLAQGGGDEESFRQRARQAERFALLAREVREREQRIEALTGQPEAAVREALAAQGGEAGLRHRLSQLHMEEPACASLLRELDTHYGAARQQLEQWEADEQLATLRRQEERLRARAAELASWHATDRLALALLARARRRFEEEQQPQLVRRASEHFEALTAGRYRRVFLPAGGRRELRVGDGRREWSAEQLSRGTREQLYLAFRLAVVQDFGETRGALPLVVDDILVNFDRERTRHALRLLARMAERHQVIAFTCHPWLHELFAAEGAQVARLASAA